VPGTTKREAQATGMLWLLSRHGGRARASLGVPGVGHADACEIEAMLDAVGAGARELALRLSLRLNPLVKRCVPPRAIEAAPVQRAARLRFADGTSVVVKSLVPGDVGVLALAIRRGSVKPAACMTEADGSTRLVFTGLAGHRQLSLRVVGLDQPD